MSDPINGLPEVQSVKLLLSDIDGVMTDGKLIYGSDEVELKAFHVRDGLGIKLWQGCGLDFGMVTARRSPIVTRRAQELSIEIVEQGRPDKRAAVSQIAQERGVELSEVCYVGDDLHDLSAIQAVGLGVTVCDAPEEIKSAAQIVLTSRGGEGAIRELVEFILKSKGVWAEAIQQFSAH